MKHPDQNIKDEEVSNNDEDENVLILKKKKSKIKRQKKRFKYLKKVQILLIELFICFLKI